MAKNLNNVMTREDAIEQFERDILPGLIQQD